MDQRYQRYFGNASAWLVIGMSVILAIVVIGLAVMNYNREQRYMADFLSEKGATLIRAFEAGARTGMMGAFGTLPRLDTLIKETAGQPDILYIAIVDPAGEIIAHSESEEIGQTFLDAREMNALEADRDVKWRTVSGESRVAFEVYKLFLPVLPDQANPHMMRMMQHRRHKMRSGMGMSQEPEWLRGLEGDKLLHPENRPIIVIGMDIATFEDAMDEDIRFTLVISAVLFLLGMAGVVSLFWAQSYTRSRKLLSNISAISSEMINNLPEGLVLTDNDLKIHYINGVAGTLLGVDAQGVVGRDASDILPEIIGSMNLSKTRNDAVLECEVQIPRKDGRMTPASVIATEVVTEDGIFVGRMYLLKDLTQLKQLQSEIQRKEKLAVIGNLAAGVAHEVRNPLSSIKGYATYFMSLFAEESENRAAAEMLVNETERLNRVITELLEISRPSDIQVKEVDIQSVFDTALRLIQPDSSRHAKTEISLDIADDLKSFVVDPDRFVQVLMNIYLNSLQAMPAGGLLSTKVVAEKDGIKITITDTGSGMSEETRKQIFNPYFTTKSTGTGLGMAIVQKIIESHGGEVTVFSVEGKGTEISLHLPNKH